MNISSSEATLLNNIPSSLKSFTSLGLSINDFMKLMKDVMYTSVPAFGDISYAIALESNTKFSWVTLKSGSSSSPYNACEVKLNWLFCLR